MRPAMSTLSAEPRPSETRAPFVGYPTRQISGNMPRMRGANRSIQRCLGLSALLALALASSVAAEEPAQHRNPPPTDGPLEVRIGFHLVNITDISEKEETIDIDGAIYMRWNDPRLAYAHAEEGLPGDWVRKAGGTPPRMYQGDFAVKEVYERWRPHVEISNGIGSRSITNLAVGVWPNGDVEYFDYFTAKIETPMKLRRYPFDRQSLKIFVSMMSYRLYEVRLVHDPALSGTWVEDLGIAEWRKLGVDIEDAIDRYEFLDGHEEELGQLLVTLHIARNAGHILWSIILPLLVLVALTWSVFWMDNESTSNRLSVSFVGILAVVAYYFVVLESIPAIPYLTLMDTFMIATFFLLAATVVVSFVVDRLNRAHEEARGDRLDEVCRWAFPLGYAVVIGGLMLGYLAF